MDNFVDYLKSLNPQDVDKAILFYGKQYRLWKEGNYLGVATWTKDSNVGDSFQVLRNGIIEVYVADKWELILKKKNEN